MQQRPFVLVLTAIAAVAAVAPSQAPPTVFDRMRHEGLENSQAMGFEDYLCNHVGQRLTGSDSFDRAAAWARDQFAAMGLNARLEPWGQWNLRWNRGQWAGRVVSPEPIELQVATPAWTAPTKGDVQGALVRMPENADQLQALQPRLEQVYLYGTRPSRRSELYEAFEAAVAAHPPLGYVVGSGETKTTDQRWPTQIRVFGDHRVAMGSWDQIPTVPDIVVRQDQAERIEDMLDAGKEVVVQFDIRNRFEKGPVELDNVIADLPGSKHPDEMVIVCSHLDSWHQATGATDNATGCSTTMEAARILTTVGARPDRTIRFILWSGEEQGLLGSQAYVEKHAAEMPKVSAVLNHDSGTNWAHGLRVTEAMYPLFEQVLQPVMSLPVPEKGYDGPVFELGKTERIGGFGGSDHASFLTAGVPAWSWGLHGESQYGYGWHSQWDTYDLVIPRYQAQTSTVIAMTALGLANLDQLLPRDGVGGGGRRSGDIASFVKDRFGVTVDEHLAVTEVVEGSAAAGAGVHKGDVVKAVWDHDVHDVVDFYRAYRRNADAEAIDYVVERGGEKQTLHAPFGAKAQQTGAEEKKAGAVVK